MPATRGRSRSKKPATSASRTPSKKKKVVRARDSKDVFLYVPQWIGYSRVFCSLLSLYLASYTSGAYYIPVIVLYLLSFIGDLFDGMAARKYDQCSKFGGVLDMVTDRATTAGMIVVLTWLYEDLRVGLLGLLILDIASHWMQMTAALMLGAHHKSDEGNKDKFFLVRWFYSNYLFFGYCCVGAELTYVLLYTLHYLPSTSPLSPPLTFTLNFVCFPACVIKNIVNVAQLASASNDIAKKDAKEWNEKNV